MMAIIPSHYSKAIDRIGEKLVQYAPAGVEIGPRTNSLGPAVRYMEHEKQGNLVVLYCNGFHDRYCALAQRLRDRGQKYAVVQIALHTTRHKSTNTWRELWRHATVVWTYYPLDAWIAEDGGAPIDFNFYNTPLGVDAEIFTDTPVVPRTITCMTSTAQRNQEGGAECDEAAFRIPGGNLFQLGNEITNMRCPTQTLKGIDDHKLAEMYRQCQFVSGLRRHEGFELPAAEGILCGARPLLYNQLHYRRWFEPWGVFVQEQRPSHVAEALFPIFQAGPTPITADERAAAVKLFNWETIVKGFWERAL